MQKIEIVDISSCKKQINVEVPAEKVSEEFKRVCKMVAQNASVPGFRPGRAPVSVVKTRFRKEIREQVMRDMLPDVLKSAIVDNKLAVVGEPNIDEFTLNEGQPLVFKAKVEVLPDFELKDYKGLPLTKKIRIITDDMVEKQLEKLRQQQANLTPVEDREVQDKDYVNVDVKGKFLNHQADDIKSEGLQLEVGSSNLQPEFTETLKGMKIGDERTFEVNYPEDSTNKTLAGKHLEYTLKLNSIKIKEVPELDDDFAQGLGEYENLADLRQKTREQFENNAKEEALERLNDVVLEKLLSDYNFEVPDFLVEGQTKERLENFITSLARQGVDPRNTQIDWMGLRNAQRDVAIKDVKVALILEKIAEKEQIELSDAELNDEIKRMAKSTDLSFDAVKSFLTKEGAIDSIKGKLRNNKVIDSIIKSSEITEELISSEELDKLVHENHEHDENCDHEHQHEHPHGDIEDNKE
ncbi:MAG: trigger factor [Acidobacteria bacterium]|nr:trigger factor [Acidobacteriota bacterium]